MIAEITNLRAEERTLELTGEVAECYVFDWTVRSSNFAFEAKLVREALKREIPAVDRGWDPDGKRWFVKVEHRKTLARLFDNFEAALKALANSPTLF